MIGIVLLRRPFRRLSHQAAAPRLGLSLNMDQAAGQIDITDRQSGYLTDAHRCCRQQSHHVAPALTTTLGASRNEVGQRGPDRLGPAHVVLGCRGVESVELTGGQPDRYDLHRFNPATRAPAAPTL